MIVVVMMVSGLRRMWRRDRPVSRAGSWLVLPRRADVAVVAGVAVGAGGADDGEEDLLEGRLLLDVFDLGRREQLLEFGEGSVGDDPSLVQDRDPVGQLFGLVQVLRGE